MGSALDVLEQGRVQGQQGLDIGLERKMIERAFDTSNSSRLETLAALVEAKIRNHDAASVCASPATDRLLRRPAASSETALEFQNHIQTHDANLAYLAAFAAVLEYTELLKVRRGRLIRFITVRYMQVDFIFAEILSSPLGESSWRREYLGKSP